jgi:hypothetical protein
MSMVCGLDLHRQQITFDALDTDTGGGSVILRRDLMAEIRGKA